MSKPKSQNKSCPKLIKMKLSLHNYPPLTITRTTFLGSTRKRTILFWMKFWLKADDSGQSGRSFFLEFYKWKRTVLAHANKHENGRSWVQADDPFSLNFINESGWSLPTRISTKMDDPRSKRTILFTLIFMHKSRRLGLE